jgi:predicted DNA-binding protein
MGRVVAFSFAVSYSSYIVINGSQCMSHVVSIRFQDSQMERLRRLARRLGRTPSEAGALLVEEALREAEFGHIDFRNSATGRLAYVKGSSLAVWEVVKLLRSYDMDVTKTARHLEWLPLRVQAALNYANAYPEEIEAAIEDEASDFLTLSRLLPQAEEWVIQSDPGE